jgi:hypothetical protein
VSRNCVSGELNNAVYRIMPEENTSITLSEAKNRWNTK